MQRAETCSLYQLPLHTTVNRDKPNCTDRRRTISDLILTSLTTMSKHIVDATTPYTYVITPR